MVSEATGWDVVPPTVLRDGPFGPGMVPAVDRHRRRRRRRWSTSWRRPRCPTGWLRVLDALGSDGEPVVLVHADDDRLRRMAVLDVVAQQRRPQGRPRAAAPDGAVHGVDHGVTFHVETKLRTVLWGWAGEPLTPTPSSRCCEPARGDLLGRRARHDAAPTLLTRREVRATARRVDRLLRDGRLPLPGRGLAGDPLAAVLTPDRVAT